MKHLRIAIDFDDTIADQTAILLPLMNWKLGTATKAEELEWDFFHRNQITEDAFWQIHDLYDSTYLRRAMPPVDPYAFPVVKELVRKGHKVDIVTRNEKRGHDSIRAWLFMHGLDLRVRPIGRGGGDAKARLGYDVFVDDNPQLADVIRRHPSKRLVIYERPWNRKVEVGRNIFRASDWLEVREILARFGA